jgi:hypothetical protein
MNPAPIASAKASLGFGSVAFLALCAIFGALALYAAVASLRSGVVGRTEKFHRKDDPREYWVLTVMLCVFGVGCLAFLAGFLLSRMG